MQTGGQTRTDPRRGGIEPPTARTRAAPRGLDESNRHLALLVVVQRRACAATAKQQRSNSEATATRAAVGAVRVVMGARQEERKKRRGGPGLLVAVAQRSTAHQLPADPELVASIYQNIVLL